MGERSLRGSRLGSVSYETERNTAPIERQYAEYRCPQGHLVTVPFADDAEVRRNSAQSDRVAADSRTVAARQQLTRTEVRAPVRVMPPR